MGKIKYIIMAAAMILVSMCLAPGLTLAIDPPHNPFDASLTGGARPVDCTSCHSTGPNDPAAPEWLKSALTSTDPDVTWINSLCMQCHQPFSGYMFSAKYYEVKTHSAKVTESSYRSGKWTVQCNVCHDHHGQPQVAANKTEPAISSVLTGSVVQVVSSLTSTISRIQISQTLATDYKDYTIVPNIVYPSRMYRIHSNAGNQVYVYGPIHLTYAKPGNTFAINHGKMVRTAVKTTSGPTTTVRFFSPATFATNTAVGGKYYGVCQVCHTQTKYFRSDNTVPVQGAHSEPANSNCTTCHKHSEGFKASCTSCHGNPPVTATKGGPDGLALLSSTSGSTGSTTPGAHNAHVTSQGIGCVSCHENSVGSGATHNSGLKVTLGFIPAGGAVISGYNGQTTANYDVSNASTTVTKTGSMTCSNIYCHSTVQHSDGFSAPTYISAKWDNSIPVQCGSCHQGNGIDGDTGSKMATAGHTKHLTTSVGATCTTCHSGNTHANRNIEVTNMGYPQPNAPQNGFGSCSTAICHANVYGAGTSTTPAWGTTDVGCSACHSITIAPTGPDTGSHVKHGETDCSKCHAGALNSSTTPTMNHPDGYINVTNGYPSTVGKHAPGSGYSTCSASACHVSAYSASSFTSPVWGDPAGCGACHPIAANGAPATGSHAKHIGSTFNAACGDCHAGAEKDVSGGSGHLNANIDVTNGYTTSVPKHPAGSGYSTCSTASCHRGQTDGGLAAVTAMTPTWDAPADCGSCHKNMSGADAYGSHPKHVVSHSYSCSVCHSGYGSGTVNASLHVNNTIDVDVLFAYTGGTTTGNHALGGGYGACSTVACHSDGKGDYRNPAWGVANALGCGFCHGNPPNTAAHRKHVSAGTTTMYGSTVVSSTSGTYFFGCGNCHPVTATGNHMNNDVQISLNRADGGTLKSLNSATATWIGSGASVQCNGVYCHSNGAIEGADTTKLVYKQTPTWGGSFGANKCGSCHDNPPQYAGQSHYNANGFMGAEGGHLVGVHFDNIYNGVTGTGLLTAVTGTTNTSHGNAGVATTITCYVCHDGIVSDTTIDTYAMNQSGSSMECGTCHNAGTNPPLQAGVITNKSLHVNAQKNVAIAAAFTLKSKAQLRTEPSASWTRNNGYKGVASYDTTTLNLSWNSTDKTCATVCHLGNTATWGDTNITCSSCHTSLQ